MSDVKVLYSSDSNAVGGWVKMDDGFIGNVGSGALNRANKDTFQLYSTLYTTVSDTYAPVGAGVGGRTAPGTTMANAITDFLLNKKMQLPLVLGRALSGLTAGQLGANFGSATMTLTPTNLPKHTHTVALGLNSGQLFVQGTGLATGATVNSGDGGSALNSTPFNLYQPTTYMNVFIKL